LSFLPRVAQDASGGVPSAIAALRGETIMSASFELNVGALRNEIEALKRKQEFWREEAEMQRLSEQIYTSRAKQRLRLLNLYVEKFNEDHHHVPRSEQEAPAAVAPALE
jgi:hypothetical protein